MSALFDLEPKAVFTYFKELTQIPRCSGNEKQVSDYLVAFAQKLQLDHIQEDCLNVIIRKPATRGYENSPQVILQAHMDMVCVKAEGLDFDFTADPLPIIVDKDLIKTEGTTLGADNGIGMAIIMALLAAEDLPHPPLVALFTVSEETGLDGAQMLNPQNVSGDILINIDGEGEGILLSSAAGGVTCKLALPTQHQEQLPGKQAVTLKVEGLLSGHSGVDIDAGRGNALKLLGRLLDHLAQVLDLDLVSVSGGEAMNVIPPSASALALIPAADEARLQQTLKEFNQILRAEFASSDPGVKITSVSGASGRPPLTDETKTKVIDLLVLLPSGINTMSAEMPGLVESSSNLGVVTQTDAEIVFAVGVRSSVKTRKTEITRKIQRLNDCLGGTLAFSADYPEWGYRLDSPLRDLMKKAYCQLFGTEPQVSAIHGGLECGYWQEKFGDIDMIAIGPDITGAHSCNETVSITSIQKLYRFICHVLTELS